MTAAFTEFSEEYITALLSKISRTSPVDVTTYHFGSSNILLFRFLLFLRKLLTFLLKIDLHLNPGSMLLLLQFRSVLLLVKVVIYRPISVTSLLCRCVEKIIVRTYVIPAYCQWRIQNLQTGGPRSSAAGASIEAPKAPRVVGCGERVSPYPLREGLGRGQCPYPENFFNFRSKKCRLLVHPERYFCSSATYFTS